MPTPTIPDGELFMNATLYTGTGATQNITNGVAGQSFQPDLVWIKARSTTTNNRLYDSVRGATLQIQSNTTDAEAVNANGLTAFGSNGFTVGSASSENASGQTFVGWQWKAGGTAVTNTAGSISSQVSANTTSGFSIVTYTGNATNNATIGHGLGVAPSMVITKNRGTSTFWYVYHSSLPATYNLYLNSTDSQQPDNVIRSTSATTFTVSSSSAANGTSMVAYCWTPIAGYSAFGSYTGNGSADGPFVYLGFRPKFIMIKASSISGENWYIVDSSRSPYNAAILYLSPNNSGAEASPGAAQFFDFLSNGFKLRVSGSYSNSSGTTYIYMAFAENPFKYANAR